MNDKHKGSLFEILAAAWLLKQGYEVYRNVSQHGIFDLTIYNPETKEFIGVDVTSSGGESKYKSKGKEYVYPHSSKSPKVKEMLENKGKLIMVDPLTHEVFWHPKFLT